jgi:hypothetical protein
LEATLYGGLVWRIDRTWSLHSTLGAGVPIVRDKFSYDDDLGRPRQLHRTRALVGRVETGAGLSF